MQKLIKNGQVAVLYSPGFGAGWYTWNQELPELIFDPSIVTWAEEEAYDKIEAYMVLKYPDAYTGGMRDLTVKWIPTGTRFRIEEYDGNESVVVEGDDDWFVA